MGDNYALDLSEDNKTPHANKCSKRERYLVTLCILVTEMGERLSYYSLVANIILFGKSALGLAEEDAATIRQVFAGVVALIPIGGGFLSDAYAGRFKTIAISGLINLVATAQWTYRLLFYLIQSFLALCSALLDMELATTFLVGIMCSKRERYLVTLCILVTEMGERLTYYSLVANIIVFGNTALGFAEDDAATISQVFTGVVYLIPIVGGFLSDAYAGRFKTIVISGLIYLVGIVFILLAAVDFEDLFDTDNVHESSKRGLFLGGFAFIALGTGGIKANVGPFGAEQLESMGKEAVQSFFNWLYWDMNIGALIAFSGVSYIQQEVSFAWGYFVPLVAMCLSLVIFVIMKNKYIRTDPNGSIMSTAFSICRQGCCQKPSDPNPLLSEGSEKKILARAKVSFGGSHKDHLVDGVGSVIKVIPFCFLLIIYWTVYAQTASTFFVQGARMDIRLEGGVNVPVAALNIFDTITVILFIPVVDRVLYPFFDRSGWPLTYLKRIGIGMILAAMALFVAGIVEIERKNRMNEPDGMHVQVLSDKEYNASSMSIFLQVPQFALIGASEIFTSVTALEFAYNQSPVAMQGLLTGLFLASTGFGSLLSSALLIIVKEATESDPWWGDEINDTKMENLLFLIGGLMVLNFVIFCIVAHYYSYQDPSTFTVAEEDEEETTTFDEKASDEAGEETKIMENSYKKYTAEEENDAFTPDPRRPCY